MHPHSLDAYRQIAQELPRKRASVYFTIVQNPGITRQALSIAMHWPINSITGRVTELINADLVMERGHSTVNGKRRAKLVAVEPKQ